MLVVSQRADGLSCERVGKQLTTRLKAISELSTCTDAVVEPPAKPIAEPSVTQSASAPVNVVIAPASVPVLLAILPFGIGQFAEKRYVAASLLLVSQVLLLAANVTVAALYYAAAPSALEGAFPSQTRSFTAGGNVDRARALQIVSWASGAALIADIVAGAIDGGLHRTLATPSR